MHTFKRLNDRLEFKLVLTTVTPLHIGERREEKEKEEGSGNLLAALLSNDGNHFLIPGSSVRGTFRNHLYSTLEQIGMPKEKIENLLNPLFGETDKKDDAKGRKGNLWIGDVVLGKNVEYIKNATPIDRILHKPAVPLQIQTIKRNTGINMKMVIENVSVYQLALLALLFKDLREQELTIGAWKSRGLGIIRLDRLEADLILPMRGSFQPNGGKMESLDEWIVEESFPFKNFKLLEVDKVINWLERYIPDLVSYLDVEVS